MSNIRILKSVFYVIQHQNQSKHIEYFKINVKEHGDLYLYKVHFSNGTMTINIFDEVGASLNLNLYVDYENNNITLIIYNLDNLSLKKKRFHLNMDHIQMSEIELVLSVSRAILDENLRVNPFTAFLNSELLDETLSRAIFLSDSDIEGI